MPTENCHLCRTEIITPSLSACSAAEPQTSLNPALNTSSRRTQRCRSGSRISRPAVTGARGDSGRRHGGITAGIVGMFSAPAAVTRRWRASSSGSTNTCVRCVCLTCGLRLFLQRFLLQTWSWRNPSPPAPTEEELNTHTLLHTTADLQHQEQVHQLSLKGTHTHTE